MKAAAVLFAALLLSGCATRPAWLENRLACADDRAFVVSLWGPIGIAAPLAARDTARACRP